MKHILKFNNYDPVEAFLLDEISEEVFFNYLNSLNEGLVDFLKSFKQKVLDVLWAILEKSVVIGFKILEKVKSIFSWLISKIKEVKEKNPTLFKVLSITVLIVLILIISGSVAHATVTGQPIKVMYIDMVIGFINDMKDNGYLEDFSKLDVLKSTAYLIKLRDAGGVLNPTDVTLFGEETITLANKSIETVKKLAEEAHSGDDSTMHYCIDILKKGETFISYEYQKLVSGGETIKIFSK